MIFIFDRVENSVKNGENAGYQHFLLFPHCLQKALQKAYENIIEKGENFLLFLQCFLTFQRQNLLFQPDSMNFCHHFNYF